jgi:23S rRNA (pseudouridine1915-N3)-methyltransferase
VKIKIISLGDRPSRWIEDAIEHYLPLVSRSTPCTLSHLKSQRASIKQSAQQVKSKEAEIILQAINPKNQIIALDEHGENWTTKQLSEQMQNWKQDGITTEFIIGGTEGLDKQVLSKANKRLALSKLTLPHQMVRVILLEQLFRASSILENHPYHR